MPCIVGSSGLENGRSRAKDSISHEIESSSI